MNEVIVESQGVGTHISLNLAWNLVPERFRKIKWFKETLYDR